MALVIDEKYLKNLERHLLAHRYLYYVKATPVISDEKYDLLDIHATKLLPKISRLNWCGSDLEESYSEDVIRHAMWLLKLYSKEVDDE